MKKFIYFVAFASAAPSIQAGALLYGVTTDNFLVSFDADNPNVFLSQNEITGTGFQPIVNIEVADPAGATFRGIDVSGNYYSINSGGSAAIVTTTPNFEPRGFDAGFAFDSFEDAFRFASDEQENILINSSGDVVTGLPDLSYSVFDINAASDPIIVALGIDPDFGEAFYIDSELDILAQAFDPSAAELDTIGSLGVDTTGLASLAIAPDGNDSVIYAALSEDAFTSQLYTIDPLTGEATLAGQIGPDGTGVTAIATTGAPVAVPEPSTSLLILLAGIPVIFRRRRTF